jgi:glycosyltransferase involved in cell wall biosynthesis
MPTTRVCLFGDYAINYPRETIIKKALLKKGIKVLECNCAIKHSKKGRGSILFYLPRAYYRLLRELLDQEVDFDFFLIPQNNRLIVPLAFLLSMIMGKRVIIDAFDLAYETALIRGLSSAEARVRFWIEHLALRLSDHVLALTEEFKQQYIKLHSLKPAKISILPPGADEDKFRYRESASCQGSDFLVLYWGNFLPHHGVDTIVEAAALLQSHKDIHFNFAGKGIEANYVQHLATQRDLNQVHFLGFVSDQELISKMREAHVCLGIFSANVKAQCSITNKVSEALSMGKAVITNESPATIRQFVDREDVYLVPPENPHALADAILKLKEDEKLRNRLEINGRKHFKKHFSVDAIGLRLLNILTNLSGHNHF